jgi:hypothetical protein
MNASVSSKLTCFRKNILDRIRLVLCISLFIVIAVSSQNAVCAKDTLSNGYGSFIFANSGKNITVWYYNPGIIPTTPVVFVMHGAERNGQEYRNSWVEYAQKGRFLLLVPEFSKEIYPDSEQYNLGNMFSESGAQIDRSEWTFTTIEKIFDQVKTVNQLEAKNYSIYGHSAGAQFVHRFVLFNPEARIKVAIAANAGWYTMPYFNVEYPYGLANSGSNPSLLIKAFSKKLVVLLGSEDTNPNHKYLSKTPGAMAQGSNRFERGEKFFRIAKTAAATGQMPFNWKLKKVWGVGHSNSKMAREAALLLGQ